MSQNNRDYYRRGYQPLHDQNLSSLWWHYGSYYNPWIEKEIFEELKPIEKEVNKDLEKHVEEGENKSKSTAKIFCLYAAVLMLLGFSMCVQANVITQALQAAAKISVQK